jgi:SAM-dependent methyltransferase
MSLAVQSSGAAGPRARMARWVRPYAGLASVYDRLVGASLFPVIRDSFEHCLRRHGIGFHSAADVGCGTGAFLSYLRGYGVPLIGVDRAPQMLRAAAARLGGANVVLLRQDLRRLRLPYPVDLITCNGDTLNYLLTEGDLLQAVRACRGNLTAGGHLIVDLLTGMPPKSLADAPDVRIAAPGRVTQWRAQVDRHRQLTRVEITLGRRTRHGWRWAREVHLQRWHRLGELRRACDAAGLRVIDWLILQAAGPPAGPAAWIKLVARREAPS